ncbi:MAG: nicotinate (nicotinamide) nucleotide adenylyltransferase [Bacillus subtilis]|nr:nicotinate (nicotinamide) nucleotide adenylyltransferase [Bacillus subtilis]
MIVVFGGAFNPPTIAHKAIHHHIVNQLPVDLFIYLPVSNHYTKRSLESNFHRMQMLNLMTKALDNVIVSPMEFEDPEYRGTYQSLVRIQERYPAKEVAFVIGADNLFKLHKWINAESLLSEFRFIVIPRDDIAIAPLFESDPFLRRHQKQFIHLPLFDSRVSSTHFRDSFDPSLVDKQVFEYINLHGLYRG